MAQLSHPAQVAMSWGGTKGARVGMKMYPDPDAKIKEDVGRRGSRRALHPPRARDPGTTNAERVVAFPTPPLPEFPNPAVTNSTPHARPRRAGGAMTPERKP